MAFNSCGRLAENSTSSSSVNSWRARNPPPVAIRHIASDSSPSMNDMLSKPSTQVLRAAIIRSRPSFGLAPRSTFGSISRRSTRASVVLPLPCSPVITRREVVPGFGTGG